MTADTRQTINALDLSFSRARQPWWSARRAEGYRLAIQCLWTGSMSPVVAQANLCEAAAAGLVVAGYTVVNRRPALVAIEMAWQAAGSLWEDLAFLAIDVEVTGTPLSTVYGAVDRALDAGRRPIVYSRRSFWVDAYGEAAPANAPVWTAERNSGADLDVIRYPWGHSPVVGKQYTGTTDIDGVSVDLNTFDAAFVLGQEDAMTPEEAARLKAVEEEVAHLKKRTDYEKYVGIPLKYAGVLLTLGKSDPILYINQLREGLDKLERELKAGRVEQ